MMMIMTIIIIIIIIIIVMGLQVDFSHFLIKMQHSKNDVSGSDSVSVLD
jgi:hypothetical protein